MTLTLELPPQLEEKIGRAASACGQSAAEYALEVLAATCDGESGPAPAYLERFLEVAQSLPDEVVARLPKDVLVEIDVIALA